MYDFDGTMATAKKIHASMSNETYMPGFLIDATVEGRYCIGDVWLTKGTLFYIYTDRNGNKHLRLWNETNCKFNAFDVQEFPNENFA